MVTNIGRLGDANSLFFADISEILEFRGLMQTTVNSVPAVKRQFLLQLGEMIITEINELISSANIDYTGAYRSSFQSRLLTIGSDFILEIGQNLTNERLPIYTQVLETGAGPNPNVPESAIIEWGLAKGFSPDAIHSILQKIRFVGITPHPILTQLFVLSQNRAIGLTPRGTALVRRAMEVFNQFIRTITFQRGRRAGQQQAMLIIPGQRARFLPSSFIQ